MSRSIYLFCQYFPYAGGEQFLFNEAEYFPQDITVNVYPQLNDGIREVDIPFDLSIHHLDNKNKPAVRKVVLSHWKLILRVFLLELLYSPHRFKYIRHFKMHFFLLIGYLQKAHIIKDQLPKDREIKLYSYWFDEWATIIHLVKCISKSQVKVVCRMHAYDFDEDQVDSGYHPFRYFNLSGFNNIFSVSEYGKNYICTKFGISTIIVSKLGVRTNGTNPFNSKKSRTIVSCSSLIPLKRVNLIPALLKEVPMDIKWVHFGTGYLENELLKDAEMLPSNIAFNFRGQVDNKEIITFYQNNSVDLFINVSELEGIPVSLMEAISFGIPVVGCNICGVPEIVNEQTGLLLEKDFNLQETAKKITEMLETKSNDINFRKGVKAFWNDNFNADKNYPEFIKKYLLN